MTKKILDLCGGTGGWSYYYAKDSDYDVIVVDPLVNGMDVRLMEYIHNAYGILCAPPCTHLSSSGARWWKDKGEEALLEALSIVDACLRVVTITKPTFWALENPVGRLSKYLGKPKMYFHPYYYCGYSTKDENYTKKTALWGEFNKPENNWPYTLPDKNYIHHQPPGPNRWRIRSATPKGFAKAFYEANR